MLIIMNIAIKKIPYKIKHNHNIDIWIPTKFLKQVYNYLYRKEAHKEWRDHKKDERGFASEHLEHSLKNPI